MDPVRGHWGVKRSVEAVAVGVVLVGVLSAFLDRRPQKIQSSSCDFPAIYNFGDSNSDTGAISAVFYSVSFSLWQYILWQTFRKSLRWASHNRFYSHGGKYNYNMHEKCGVKKTINGKEVVIANSCSDPSTRIIWDGTHFTEAANKWIFHKL